MDEWNRLHMGSKTSFARQAGVRAPERPRLAALRTARDTRIGRFGLFDGARARWHHWEWLDEEWPNHPFYMHPDPDEPAPAEALSLCYTLPPDIIGAQATSQDLDLSPFDRVYDVFRVDGPPRLLAVLGVTARSLHWFDVAMGGALELMPGWLAFEPRREGRLSNVTRRLVQPYARSREERLSLPPTSTSEVSPEGHLSTHRRSRSAAA